MLELPRHQVRLFWRLAFGVYGVGHGQKVAANDAMRGVALPLKNFGTSPN